MKPLFVFVCTLLISLASCVKKEAEIKEVEAEMPATLLVHNVFLNLKDSLSDSRYDSIMLELAKLKDVNGVLYYSFGEKANTGDARLDPNFDLALQVEFESEADLNIYAKDSLHLDVRSKIKDYLEAAPVVFDYWTK